MNFTLQREDRFPSGTTVYVYPRAAWRPDTSPSGASVTSAAVNDGAAIFTDLDEGGRYVAYAQVGGEHRYVNFMAPYRSDLAKEDGAHGVWDGASGRVAYETTPNGVRVTFDHAVASKTDAASLPAWKAMQHAAAFQQAVDRAEELAQGGVAYVYVDGNGTDNCVVSIYGTTRQPSNVRLWAHESVTLVCHPAWEANGPVLALKRDENNHDIPLENGVIESVNIDGQYQLNENFNVPITTTADANFATSGTDGSVTGTGGPDKVLSSMSVTVSGSIGIPTTGGRMLFKSYTGDNVGLITYTSTTGGTAGATGRVVGTVTLNNCTYVDQSNSTPIDVPSGTLFRYYGATTTELVRIHGFHRLWINRCVWTDSGSQPFQAGGHPYESGSLEKDSLVLSWSEFSRSYNSDGVDIKSSAHVTVIHCEGHGSHDAAFDIRGYSVTLIGVDASYSHAGINISCTSSVKVQPAQGLPADITEATGQTVTVSSKVNTNWPATFTGMVGQTEYVSGTLSGNTATLSGRGLKGTIPRAWKQFGGTRISFLQADVADIHTELSLTAQSSAMLVACWADHCSGNGITVSGSGTGLTTAHITLCQTNYCRASGITCRATRGVTECTISQCSVKYCGFNYAQTFVWGTETGDGSANGTPAIWLRNCLSALVSQVIVTDNGNDAIEALDCGNGVQLSLITARNNGGYAFDGGTTNSTTKRVHWDGIGDLRGNALGVYRLPDDCTVSGSVFGSMSSRFQPARSWMVRSPHEEGNFSLPLMDGVVYAAIADTPGAIPVRRLAAYVKSAATTGTTVSKLALATVNRATGAFTVVASTPSGVGSSSIYAATRDLLQNLANSATVWPDISRSYAFLAFVKTSGTSPQIAGLRPPNLMVSDQYRMRCGVLTGQTDIPSSGTLVRTVALTSVATTNTSTTVTCASTSGLVIGMEVVNSSLPVGAYVTAINANGTDFTVSSAATADSSGGSSTAYFDVIPCIGGLVAAS